MNLSETLAKSEGIEDVKNIIFDLGNVLIDIDESASVRRFDQLLDLGQSAEKVAAIYDLIPPFEVGTLTEKEFVDAIREIGYKKDVSDQQLIDAWNEMLLGIARQRWMMLDYLRYSYKLYVLSNTNETHLRWVNTYLHNTYQKDSLNPYFDKIYLSHEIGRRKPDASTFSWVCDDAGIEPHQTLFIDDRLENIEGAQSIGLKTYLHPEGSEIVEVLKYLF